LYKIALEYGCRSFVPRIVIGAMIFKYELDLCYIKTIEVIRENMYIQHFFWFV